MKLKFSKSLLVSAKIVIAVVLLGWVISQVHWRDYVIVRQGFGDVGKVYAVFSSESDDSRQKLDRIAFRLEAGACPPWRVTAEATADRTCLPVGR